MKLLILDYLNRWRWLNIPEAILLTLCWTVMMVKSDTLLNVPIAFYFGSLLLSWDLTRGTAKAAYVLPLTRKQIANSWWCLATVIPAALNLVTKLIAGVIAAIGYSLPTGYVSWLTFSTVCDLAYAGAFFFVLTGMPAGRLNGFVQNIKAVVMGAVWGLGTVGSFLMIRRLPTNWETMSNVAWLILVVALVLTAAGYFRSAGLVVTRASFRLTDNSGTPRTTHAKTGSWGRQLTGLPRIFWTAFSTSVSFTAMVCVVFAVMMVFVFRQSQNSQSPSFYLAWVAWLLVMQNLRWLMSLRHLRVLPLTTGQLNALLLALNFTATLGLAAFVNASHFLVPRYFPWQMTPDTLVALAGVSCLMSFVAMRWGMPAIIVCMMVIPMLSVVGLASPANWIYSTIMTPPFFYLAGLTLMGLAAGLNQRSLARNNAIYKPMKTPFAQAWGTQGV